MFNITTAVDTLRDAETVFASTNLTSDEKNALLSQLRVTIPPQLPGVGPFALTVLGAIDRMIASGTTTGTDAAPKQGRKAKRVQDTTEVAAGPTEGAPEAASGPTEGGEVPTEDAGRAAADVSGASEA